MRECTDDTQAETDVNRNVVAGAALIASSLVGTNATAVSSLDSGASDFIHDQYNLEEVKVHEEIDTSIEGDNGGHTPMPPWATAQSPAPLTVDPITIGVTAGPNENFDDFVPNKVMLAMDVGRGSNPDLNALLRNIEQTAAIHVDHPTQS